MVCEHETTHLNISKSKLQKLVNYHQIIESNTSCNNNNYYNSSIGTEIVYRVSRRKRATHSTKHNFGDKAIFAVLEIRNRAKAIQMANPNFPLPHTTASQVILKWPLGMVAASLASIFFVLGLQLMHSGVNKKYRASAGEDQNIRQRLDRSWWLGLLSHLLAAFCILVALNFATLGLVMPVSCLTLIINTVCVPLINEDERKIQTASDWSAFKGCLIAILGALFMVSSAEKYNTAFSADHLEMLFQRYDFIALEIVCIFIICFLFYFARTRPRRHHGRRSFLLSFFSFSAGWAGAQQYILLKALLEIWKASHLGKSLFLNPTSISFLICCIFLVCLQLLLVNTALKIFSNETIRFIGVYQACLLLVGCISGGVYFQEFVQFDRWQWIFFVLGLLFMLWGIGIITLLRGIREDVHTYMEIDQKDFLGYRYIYWICGPCQVLSRKESEYSLKTPSYEDDALMTAEFDQVWGKDVLW